MVPWGGYLVQFGRTGATWEWGQDGRERSELFRKVHFKFSVEKVHSRMREIDRKSENWGKKVVESSPSSPPYHFGIVGTDQRNLNPIGIEGSWEKNFSIPRSAQSTFPCRYVYGIPFWVILLLELLVLNPVALESSGWERGPCLCQSQDHLHP